MREEITFKTVDDIIEYYRWGSYAEKRGEKKDVPDKTDGLSGAGKDSSGKRNADKHSSEGVQAQYGEGL